MVDKPVTHTQPAPDDRRPGELNARELARWSWRQLTSMRTALILLLLLALAAVPGSLIPQSGVDSLKTSQWQEAHTHLTPIYKRLGLFDVYSSPWFGAIYILLMISLIGCIIPRLFVYWRGLRAQPPVAPRHLTRMADSSSYVTTEVPADVLDRARVVLRKKRYRLRRDAEDYVSAEKGYLREAGNLLFHLSVILVLVGFAMGSLLGYKGGVIVVVGKDYGFSNTPQQYDDLDPGSLFDSSRMDPFTFHIDKFDVDWLTSGPRKGMARAFDSKLSYCPQSSCTAAEEKSYNLRVNHPLTIGSTELFLIGHGYAPEITIRDAKGKILFTGPQVFLPENATFFSFGVVKGSNTPNVKDQIGLQGVFYPTFIMDDAGNPTTLMGNDLNPLISMQVWAGDLNLDAGPQSVYSLDTSKSKQVMTTDPTTGKAKPLRLDMQVGQTVTLPNGLGSVSFDGVVRWNKIQISQQPGKYLALGGVLLCLLGLLGSLFIRPRRLWVRATASEEGTLVEIAGLDRSGGDDTAAVISDLVSRLQQKEQA
ncbi:cytochrome c biogenesis protein ResB [Nocardioides sp. Kera G14]|uniref:cytochrome c biogenesis protein ResB n=1 Tax=Nocardioides sp. Kera G14 TaxID=2884264 RepID=UPI001D10FE65|nr:cytochrome c biogenesis protein ResB [Nocardioides sp. Kera G14]UDY23890.1 cytochrome c biogenesis protein ResB [Nocardioides sp. Kera G14]